MEHKIRVFSAVCWPFGKRVIELLILGKKEREAESQYYSAGKWGIVARLIVAGTGAVTTICGG